MEYASILSSKKWNIKSVAPASLTASYMPEINMIFDFRFLASRIRVYVYILFDWPIATRQTIKFSDKYERNSGPGVASPHARRSHFTCTFFLFRSNVACVQVSTQKKLCQIKQMNSLWGEQAISHEARQAADEMLQVMATYGVLSHAFPPSSSVVDRIVRLSFRILFFIHSFFASHLSIMFSAVFFIVLSAINKLCIWIST